MSVISFIRENKKSILVGTLSFLTCGSLIAGLWGTGEAVKYFKNKNTKEACVEAYKMMCVQVHACGAGTVQNCDETVQSMRRCDNIEVLPSAEIIKACTQDLRYIECTSDVPGTCQTFMLE